MSASRLIHFLNPDISAEMCRKPLLSDSLSRTKNTTEEKTEAVVKQINLVPPSAKRPFAMEAEWLAIDGLGTVRNALSTASSFVPATATVASKIFTSIPFFQIVGGTMILHSAIKYTLPNSWKEFQEALEKDTKEGKIVAGLGFTNQVLFTAMGAGLLGAGATGVLSPAVANILGYAPMVSSAVVQAIGTGALGGVCVVRGSVMMGRAIYNLSYLMPFHDEFKTSITESKEAKFLKTEWAKGEENFTRRVGGEAAKMVKEWIESGAKSSPSIEILKAVDKGIFKQKCKQWLIVAIAGLTILGGIACIVFSGGIAGIVISAFIGIAFANTEALWLVFDSGALFDKFVNFLYKEPENFQAMFAEKVPQTG